VLTQNGKHSTKKSVTEKEESEINCCVGLRNAQNKNKVISNRKTQIE
jgi:hypothetical protein